MPKDRSDTKSEQATCYVCDPVESVRREVGSGIGAERHKHYLTFASTDELEKHLRAVAWFPKPLLGNDFDAWVASVLVWHRQKRAWIAEDERRWGSGRRSE